MATTGHSGSHSVQSMHSSGSITRKFGPSWKQSTGQTSTQSIYLHLMQLSVTTNAMTYPSLDQLNVNTILPQPRNGSRMPLIIKISAGGSTRRNDDPRVLRCDP